MVVDFLSTFLSPGVGPPLAIVHRLRLPLLVEVTGYSHRWPFGLLARHLPGQWDALMVRISSHVTVRCRELNPSFS